jgi:hypothetical protein
VSDDRPEKGFTKLRDFILSGHNVIADEHTFSVAIIIVIVNFYRLVSKPLDSPDPPPRSVTPSGSFLWFGSWIGRLCFRDGLNWVFGSCRKFTKLS